MTREDAIGILKDERWYMSRYSEEYKEVYDMAIEALQAEEVVRCGECKHWYADADAGMACEFTNLGQPEDGFCNWGERGEP